MKKLILIVAMIIGGSVHELKSQLIFEKSEYASRREKLMKMIPNGIAIIRGASVPLGNGHFYQFNNMMYFTGVEMPNVILIVDGKSGKVQFFLPLTNRLLTEKIFR